MALWPAFRMVVPTGLLFNISYLFIEIKKGLIFLDRKRELKLAYKQTPLPMGVYQIKNNANGKILIGSSMNLPGIFNRHRFQLNASVHRTKELQEDWNSYGPDAFTWDVLETLKAEEIPEADWSKAILALEEKWLTNLQPYDENGYNKLKLMRK